ncbi:MULTISPECIES: DUF6328 family protein [unclassified Isoptericola]|uniref:DUF6328 family protein n=1 Tax=Isoptericola sp. NPDC057191 TaxID=3346041 RepID=UPI00363F1B56
MTDEPTGGVPDHGRGRSETPEQRSDRNWVELLQELRVMQTGVQILTGFLLTLPFQQRFADLDSYQVGLYLVLVVLSVATTGMLVSPVTLHRALFRRRLKQEIVTGGDRMTRVAIVLMAFVMTGAVMLVFDVVVSRAAGVVVGASILGVLLVLWVVVPLVVRRRS